MATLREYFDTDNPVLRQHSEWSFPLPEGDVPVIAKMHYDFTTNAKYWSVYVPANSDPVELLKSIITNTPLKTGDMPNDGVLVKMGDSTGQFTDKSELVFTNRVLFYVEDDVADAVPELRAIAAAHGIPSIFYGHEYVKNRSMSEKPLAFISHDSRDKDALVRELATELSRMMCPVWYDEFSLKVGDNLRESIDRGLKESKYCILILSPNFFSNTGWVRAEFDGVHIREMIEEQDILLPVWHNVSAKDVYDYNARLANKVGVSTAKGVTDVAGKLAQKLKAA